MQIKSQTLQEEGALEIIIDCPGKDFTQGEQVTLNMTITNIGNVTVPLISAVDIITVPAGITIANVTTDFAQSFPGPFAGPNLVILTSDVLGSLDPGQSLQIQVTFQITAVTAAGFINNEATTASGDIFDKDSCSIRVIVDTPIRGIDFMKFSNIYRC